MRRARSASALTPPRSLRSRAARPWAGPRPRVSRSRRGAGAPRLELLPRLAGYAATHSLGSLAPLAHLGHTWRFATLGHTRLARASRDLGAHSPAPRTRPRGSFRARSARPPLAPRARCAPATPSLRSGTACAHLALGSRCSSASLRSTSSQRPGLGAGPRPRFARPRPSPRPRSAPLR